MAIQTSNWRGFLLSFWWVTLTSTLASSAYLSQNGGALPQSLEQTWVLCLGLWLGGILAAVNLLYLRWESPRDSLRTALWAYGLAALLRVMFWGAFLPHGDDRFMVIWRLVSLQALPAYDSFILAIFLLGPILIILAGLMAHNGFLWLNLVYPFDSRVSERALWGLLGLMPLLMMSLVLARTARADLQTAELNLVNTHWLMSPATNLVLAALLGLGIGWSSLCETRFSAAMTLAIAGCGHVFLMFILEPVLATYDPFHTPLDPNQVPVGEFLLFWLGVPGMGALAAFAAHNLREALMMEEVATSQ